MNATQMRTIADRSITRKVVGSLAVLGAAAAVAGLGTYGTFTDSTSPVDTTVQTGTLSINLAQPWGSVGIPVTTSGFVPGDSMTRAVDLLNDGGAALGSVSLQASVTSVLNELVTDATNSLQPAVKACSVMWTQGGTTSAPTYTCSGTERTILSAPVANTGNVPLDNPASLAAGGSDQLTFSVSMPTSADNSFQGKSASLSLTFVGTQRAGTAR